MENFSKTNNSKTKNVERFNRPESSSGRKSPDFIRLQTQAQYHASDSSLSMNNQASEIDSHHHMGDHGHTFQSLDSLEVRELIESHYKEKYLEDKKKVKWIINQIKWCNDYYKSNIEEYRGAATFYNNRFNSVLDSHISEISKYEIKKQEFYDKVDEYSEKLQRVGEQDHMWQEKVDDIQIDPRISYSPFVLNQYREAMRRLDRERVPIDQACRNLIGQMRELLNISSNLEKEAETLGQNDANLQELESELYKNIDKNSKEGTLLSRRVVDDSKNTINSAFCDYYRRIFQYLNILPEELPAMQQIKEEMDSVKQMTHKCIEDYTMITISLSEAPKEYYLLLGKALRGEPDVLSAIKKFSLIPDSLQQIKEIEARIGVIQLFGLENDAKMRAMLVEQPLPYRNNNLDVRPTIANALQLENRDEIRLMINNLLQTKNDQEIYSALATFGNIIHNPEPGYDMPTDRWHQFIKVFDLDPL